MPIRFACPHCHQKLSVSSRKAGTVADCPRCKRHLHIPTPPPEPVAPPPEQETLAAPERTSPPSVAEAVDEPAADVVAATSVVASPPPAEPAAGVAAEAVIETPVDAVFTPDTPEFEGLELVYDNPPDEQTGPALSASADRVTIPRSAIYLQGGLLGLVALLAFAIGVLTGGAILTQPAAPAAPEACIITGSVMYAAGARELPDEGAVIAIVPQTGAKPDEKAPVEGLRPGDPSPGENHRGIAILRAAGGDYARADGNGRFQVKLPDRGRYLVLAISNQKKLRSVEEIQTADILKIGPFFDSAADLLGNRQYQVRQEHFRGDRELSVTFE